MNGIIISPSLMCADQLRLFDELTALEAAGADYLHIDVMDGEFVPNIQLGVELMKAIKKQFKTPLDIHLMIEAPHRKLDYFPIGEGDMVSVHYESTPHPQRVLSAIRERGAKALLALNPATPLCVCEDILSSVDGLLIMTVNPGYSGQSMVDGMLEKIRRAADTAGKDKIIEVDGNVSFENAEKMRKAGANALVCGSSSIFSGAYDYKDAVKRLKGEK